MPKFSQYFKLGLSQRELDFVDITTDRDTPVYVDPYAIEIRDDLWANTASEHIRTFFIEVLAALRSGDDARAQNLMSHFQEPNETCLGVSRGEPAGRGVGNIQSGQLIRAIKKSSAYATGLLSDLSEMSLYVERMDRDKISDLTTNIIRFLLAQYTKEQCEIYGIPMQQYVGPAGWSVDRLNWESRYLQLPYIEGKALLLVPKYIVRRRLSLDSQEFYNKQITDFLVAEHLKANSSLVHSIKGGKVKKVFKRDVRADKPKSKSLIADIVQKNPSLLVLFKEIAKKRGAEAIFGDSEPSLQVVCEAISASLHDTPPGREDAEKYHRLVLAALTVLFYPSLIHPHKEWDIHDGRKRVDIVYTNAANEGFFAHRRDAANTAATVVVVECKNYSSDIGNAELDQLAGRFDDNRGRFGIIACRNVEDEQLLLRRCRDIAVRGLGFVICLTDADLVQMLAHKSQLDDEAIEHRLHSKFRALLE